MKNYGMTPEFWSELIIILLIVIFLMSIIPALIRYKMGADKNKWFSYNHINKLHKKIDWTLRIIFLISVLLSAIYLYEQPLLISLIFIFFILSQIIVQAYVEWKFSDNKKNFKATLIQFGLTFIALVGALFWIKYF